MPEENFGRVAMRAQLKAVLPRELLASVVVFLVALPLCMGIAIASGLPPAKGLITGIIGGLVVGFLAGSKLQVSGPAAGLAVLVFELVRQHGVAMLGPILLLAGLLQLLAGRFRLGCWFRVTAPAVVYGMLAGIGVLIVLSQVHVMLDAAPKPSGLDNLAAFPAAVAQALPSFGWQAGLLGLSTIAVMWLWEKFRPHSLRFIPGALLGVGLATIASLMLALQVKRVEVPENLAEAIDWLRPADLLNLADPTLLIAAFAVAFIASAETLLSAAAVDRMHSGDRADFDRELSAQGIGNMLCGLLGALPMTGVIVRSSANVQAGATTRMSTIFPRPVVVALRAVAVQRTAKHSGGEPGGGCWCTPVSNWWTSRRFAAWVAMAGCRCSPMPQRRWRSSSPTC
nr:hypothetical protein GCM10020185_31500 [Pseudomonas brassicacearum subsp. brassicacearum]